jgi:hypothetical protein
MPRGPDAVLPGWTFERNKQARQQDGQQDEEATPVDAKGDVVISKVTSKEDIEMDSKKEAHHTREDCAIVQTSDNL